MYWSKASKFGKLLLTMKKYLIILALPLLIAASLPTLPKSGKSLQDFVPRGWHILAVTEGDIDADSDSDIVLALADDREKTLKESDSKQYPRLLVFLARDGDHYNLVATSDKVLLAKDSAGDHFSKPIVEDGAVIVAHKDVGKQRKTVTHRFQYKDGTWYLAKTTTQTPASNGSSTTTVETDYTTGKQIQKTSGTGKKGILKYINFTPKPMTSISAFNIGQTMMDIDNVGQ